MTFKRGFKAEADRKVDATRGALGLELEAPMDLEALAAHVGATLQPLSGLNGCHDAVAQLTQVDIKAFSGACVERNDQRLIVVNDAHSAPRQASTIAHECSHLLFGHRPAQQIAGIGLRVFDEEVEREADWLAGCLLVPTPAAYSVMKRLGRLDSAAAHFGVSVPLMRQRFNMSGAAARLQRAAKRR